VENRELILGNTFQGGKIYHCLTKYHAVSLNFSQVVLSYSHRKWRSGIWWEEPLREGL